jgi:hypothetical protein
MQKTFFILLPGGIVKVEFSRAVHAQTFRELIKGNRTDLKMLLNGGIRDYVLELIQGRHNPNTAEVSLVQTHEVPSNTKTINLVD